MASMQEIQNRIESVGVTRQIAQAMQLVSNTKIRRCREVVEGSRPFFSETLNLLETVVGAADAFGPAFRQQEGKALYLVVGSDRGLCGGYNVNICRLANTLIQGEPQGAMLFALGSRVGDFFARREVPIEKRYRGISQSPFYTDGKDVATQALDLFRRGVVSKVVLVYTVFETMLSHRPTSLQLLPLRRPAPGESDRTVHLEPDAEEMLELLLPDYLAGSIFGALAEGSMCEQSARITSMDAAVKNCAELLEEMQLQYNQARQGAITQEINEIISGAEAL